jgi:hypothetical protein
MFSRPASNTLAAFFFAFAAAFPAGSWLILLFVADPAHFTPLEGAAAQLRYAFSAENPELWWFVSWACLPLLLLSLAAAYFTGQARPRGQGRWLFGVAVVVTVASPFVWPSVLLPLLAALYYAYLCLRET